MNTRKLIAEGVGTFILVGMGSMAILATGAVDGSPALVVIPIGFGLGLLAGRGRTRVAGPADHETHAANADGRATRAADVT